MISHWSPMAARSELVTSPEALRSLPTVRKPSKSRIACRSFSTFNLSILKILQHALTQLFDLALHLAPHSKFAGVGAAVSSSERRVGVEPNARIQQRAAGVGRAPLKKSQVVGVQ